MSTKFRNKKIIIMKKYKQEYDAKFGSFGEERLINNPNDLYMLNKDELLQHNDNYDNDGMSFT